MCDTFGFLSKDASVFAKNSDRSPNEPQVIEYHPSCCPGEDEVNMTYITVPQAKETHAVLLSRPTWLWGAEIGVNDCGVCIGNEAVWTLGKYGENALTGMDLLRLGLERSSCADEAASVIIEMLERFGQGGNCGYDHDFHYDNSFLIMDLSHLLVLETAGKEWALKSYERASISNRLSIGSDADVYSDGKKCNFALKHTEHLYNIASGSDSRRRMTGSCLVKASTVLDAMNALRAHSGKFNPFEKGSVSSPCMHFGGIVGDHTTSSMVVELREGRSVIWATGSSCPCVSLYKPWMFGDIPSPMMERGTEYWYTQEAFRRSLLGKTLPADFYAERNALEAEWIYYSSEICPEFTRFCFEQERAFFERWRNVPLKAASPSAAFTARWGKKTAVLQQEAAGAGVSLNL